MREGKVYLAGGGCGDAGLLTLRAFQVLRVCDTVVYDSLVPEALLQWTSSDCEKIYVGKRYGSHAMKQSQINALLVDRAQAGKTVVRLKGGDPYVFGRGGEEFLALQAAGICCEEIPGISSAIAVPAAAGIPVTHRGLASGVTVVTGTAAEEDGQAGPHLDFDTLARLDGTLVILMGMHHLREIAEGLLDAGKEPDTPCAIVMEGTTGRQRCMRTVLSRLHEEADEQGFTSPAVIVIGAVAKLELKAEKEPERLERKQGAGKEVNRILESIPGRITVGATGTPHFVTKLSAAFAEKDVDVWDMGFMEVRPDGSPLPELSDCGWLVFTSPNGVGVFLDKMRQERKDLRILCGKRIAVIGAGTAAALEAAGLYADYMPEVYDAEHLARGLAEKIGEEQREGRADHVPAVFLRARQGSEALPRIFAKRGLSFLEYPLYDLEIQEEKRAAVIGKEPDYLVFGSAAGVRAYFEGMKSAGIVNEKSRYVCIGNRCGEELKKHTERSFITARESGVEAIAEAILKTERRKECIDSEDCGGTGESAP